jgi:hypothetical protein
MVHKHGAMIKSSNGFPMQSPYLSHLNRGPIGAIQLSWDHRGTQRIGDVEGNLRVLIEPHWFHFW